jgi:rhodanese-related sulfurtransferase
MGNLSELDDVPKDTQIIVYCLTGSRSNVAMHILRAKGFTNLANGINQNQVSARFL